MQTATETERKYDVPAGFVLPDLVGAGPVTRLGPAETHALDATYFDTVDLDLARYRRTLRRRTGGTDAGWHLKTPGDGSSRTEHRLPLGDDADPVPPELVAEVRAIVRTRPLRPVARLRTERVEAPLLDDAGRTLALIAQDRVRAQTDDGEQSWQELEVELVDGAPKLLRSVERRLLAAGARPAAGPSKLARALGDRLSTATADQGDGSAGRSAADAVLGYARAQRDAIVANDPAVRHGDAEAVHQMRVATRRLRSTLRTFRRRWDRQQAVFLRGELKWLTGELGTVRDAQVLAGRLTAAVERAGPAFAPVAVRVREHFDGRVRDGHRDLAGALDDRRYLRLLDDLDELFDGSASAGGRGKATVRRPAAKALAAADALLDAATDGTAANTDERDEQLHDARKELKRARYAVEVFVPTVGKPAKRLVRRLTALQDVLGTHQDSVVARQELRELAGAANAAGDDGFPYGVLHARQEHAGEAVLADLPAATRAARRPKLRRWLR